MKTPRSLSVLLAVISIAVCDMAKAQPAPPARLVELTNPQRLLEKLSPDAPKSKPFREKLGSANAIILQNSTHQKMHIIINGEYYLNTRTNEPLEFPPRLKFPLAIGAYPRRGEVLVIALVTLEKDPRAVVRSFSFPDFVKNGEFCPGEFTVTETDLIRIGDLSEASVKAVLPTPFASELAKRISVAAPRKGIPTVPVPSPNVYPSEADVALQAEKAKQWREELERYYAEKAQSAMASNIPSKP